MLDKHGNPVQKDLSSHCQWPQVVAGEAPDCTKFPEERTITQGIARLQTQTEQQANSDSLCENQGKGLKNESAIKSSPALALTSLSQCNSTQGTSTQRLWGMRGPPELGHPLAVTTATPKVRTRRSKAKCHSDSVGARHSSSKDPLSV